MLIVAGVLIIARRTDCGRYWYPYQLAEDICQSLPTFNSLNEDDVKNWCETDLPDVGYEMFIGDEIVTYVSTER